MQTIGLPALMNVIAPAEPPLVAIATNVCVAAEPSRAGAPPLD